MTPGERETARCEHSDHPTFIAAVHIDYIGDTEGWDPVFVRSAKFGDMHALIYFDACIAVTLYETCHGVWDRKSGASLLGPKALWNGGYQLSRAGLDRVAEIEASRADKQGAA